MIWVLVVVALITIVVFRWLKRGAGKINDYFCNAVTVYVLAGEDAAKVAALTAAKVAAGKQRVSMVNFLFGIASDLKELSGGDVIQRRLLELADEIRARDWSVDNIRAQKEFLRKVSPEYLAALNKFDSEVFQRKWPSVFHFEKARVEQVQALDRLRTELLKLRELTPEDKEIVKSYTKLQDVIVIPRDAMQIIGEYGMVLTEDSRPLKPISALPYPKETIKQAIETALERAQDFELRQDLHTALDVLQDFIPDETVPKDLEENKNAWLIHRVGRLL